MDLKQIWSEHTNVQMEIFRLDLVCLSHVCVFPVTVPAKNPQVTGDRAVSQNLLSIAVPFDLCLVFRMSFGQLVEHDLSGLAQHVSLLVIFSLLTMHLGKP